MFGGSKHATVVAYLALFFAVSGSAWAVTRSRSSPMISGCAAEHGAALRIARKSGRCARGERAVVWNRRGVAGRPGPAGQQGAPGARGPAGPAGPGGPGETSRFFTQQQAD